MGLTVTWFHQLHTVCNEWRLVLNEWSIWNIINGFTQAYNLRILKQSDVDAYSDKWLPIYMYVYVAINKG